LEQPFNADYVQRLIGGDQHVVSHFQAHFSSLLKLKLCRDSRTRPLAEDATQETFLRVLRNLRRNPNLLEQPEKLGAYVLGVCNHVAQELVRSEFRYKGMETDGEAGADPRPAAVEVLQNQQRRQAVLAALQGLSDRDRRLLVRVFYEEKDKDEVCAEFQIDRSYLRVLVHRAIQRCKSVVTGEKI
jgi:RNA polymerase sigma-70 factor (ECF subfamily)